MHYLGDDYPLNFLCRGFHHQNCFRRITLIALRMMDWREKDEYKDLTSSTYSISVDDMIFHALAQIGKLVDY